MSAAFAACSTSLLCIILLKDRTNNSIFSGGCTQKLAEEMIPPRQSRPADLRRAVEDLNSVQELISESGSAGIKDVTGSFQPHPSHQLDFAIIGWPKTGKPLGIWFLFFNYRLSLVFSHHHVDIFSGTSFLLSVLGEHPEISMPEDEFCDIIYTERNLTSWLQEKKSLESSQPPSVPQKYGIKCPQMIRRTKSIENLMKLSDSTR